MGVMEMREVAERVLYGTSLDEKLLLSPRVVVDSRPEIGLILPERPGRPPELMISERGVKNDFPGTNKMDDVVERGKMMHFLANHELLATELMALVLLKFPNAPAEFRAGVYETMREEQAHTLMYMRRMKECGMEFGELPVNDYFWRMVAPMECPMDYVSRLSLVFEQANLDYSKHYAGLFNEVGDRATAGVLEKIYRDEIDHVGYGLRWFRKWKAEGLTDWKAFGKQLHFPLTLARAKGMAPYNAEGRRLAGIDEEWIDNLEVIEQSRGRTPIVHWFNPNEELAMAAAVKNFQAKKGQLLLETDLSILPIAWARRDDVVLVREMPSREHLVRLKGWGFPLPEFVVIGEDAGLLDRKLGGLSPWAWGPVASGLMERFAASVPAVAERQWRQPVAPDLFSKLAGVQLADRLGEHVGRWCQSEDEVRVAVEELKDLLGAGGVLMKAALSSAGRGHCRLLGEDCWSERNLGWVRNVLANQGGLVVEPWLDRVLDFSAQYEVGRDGVKFKGMTRVLNDAAGRYLGTFVHARWAKGLEPELAKFLFSESAVMELYRQKFPELIGQMVDDQYRGNFGVDAMVYRDASGYHLRKVVEVNPRMTMGRVALELHKKTQPGKAGFFEIVRKESLGDVEAWMGGLEQSSAAPLVSDGSYPLNDPMAAEKFIAVWHVRSKIGEVMGLIDLE